VEISWLGYGCVRVRARTAATVMDPYAREGGLDMNRPNADIVTVSHDDPRHSNVAGVRGEPLVITGPGEYEVQGIQIGATRTSLKGAAGGVTGRNIAFVMEAEGLHVAHLGCIGGPPTAEEAEALSNTDILLVPIGPDGLSANDAARTVRTLEPTMIIPIGYSTAGTEDPDLKAFLVAVGIAPQAPVQRFSVQSRGTETQRVILLDCRG
jgi:L-ascorbate metabolism protein UlaG (beta-lactamase superfamily)